MNIPFVMSRLPIIS